MIHIKKYANRRLYDSTRSTYVNLDDLTALIRDGHDVEIVDAKTGEDLTREVLLQVVLETLRGVDFFPTGMLRRIIRSSGDAPADRLVRQQLVTGLDLLSAQLDRMEALFPAPKAPPPPPVAPVPPPEPPGAEDGDAELSALRERLASLEKRLKRG